VAATLAEAGATVTVQAAAGWDTVNRALPTEMLPLRVLVVLLAEAV